MQDKISKKCNELRDLLIRKNNSYGNSVFERGVVFDVDPIYAIQARINDKLNRLKNNDSTFASENDLQDLTGYLILLQVMIEEKSGAVKDNWKDDVLGMTKLNETLPDWVETSSEDDE